MQRLLLPPFSRATKWSTCAWFFGFVFGRKVGHSKSRYGSPGSSERSLPPFIHRLAKRTVFFWSSVIFFLSQSWCCRKELGRSTCRVPVRLYRENGGASCKRMFQIALQILRILNADA